MCRQKRETMKKGTRKTGIEPTLLPAHQQQK